MFYNSNENIKSAPQIRTQNCLLCFVESINKPEKKGSLLPMSWLCAAQGDKQCFWGEGTLLQARCALPRCDCPAELLALGLKGSVLCSGPQGTLRLTFCLRWKWCHQASLFMVCPFLVCMSISLALQLLVGDKFAWNKAQKKNMTTSKS